MQGAFGKIVVGQLRAAVLASERTADGGACTELVVQPGGHPGAVPAVEPVVLWPALVRGRWALIDAFAAAGVRYVIARELPARAAPRRALPRRSLIILEHALAGRSSKWIALELGVSQPTVARALGAALRRLGVADTAALAGVPTAQFVPLDGVDEERGAARLAFARLAPLGHALAGLTPAERDVVACIVSGKRAAVIAHERGSSPRTVANQIAAVHAKLGVSSRRELLALLASAGSAPRIAPATAPRTAPRTAKDLTMDCDAARGLFVISNIDQTPH
jgi:DNA-binding CsgD family transcriptional regulator